MKDRDDVEESRFERLLRAAYTEGVDPALLAWDRWVERSGLRSLIDQSIEAEILKEGFLLGYRAAEAFFDGRDAHQKEVEHPTPEAVTEEVERPLDGGATEEGVAGPAPLGEATLDQGPEVEGVGGDLKMYRWGDWVAFADGPVEYRGISVEGPKLGTIIVGLANRVRELEGTLIKVRPAVERGRWGVDTTATSWYDALRKIDQVLSSSGSDGGDGAT